MSRYLPKQLPFKYEGCRFCIVANLAQELIEADNYSWEYIRERWQGIGPEFGPKYLVRTTWPWPCYDPSTGTYYYVVSEVLDRIAP